MGRREGYRRTGTLVTITDLITENLGGTDPTCYFVLMFDLLFFVLVLGFFLCF